VINAVPSCEKMLIERLAYASAAEVAVIRRPVPTDARTDFDVPSSSQYAQRARQWERTVQSRLAGRTLDTRLKKKPGD